MNKIRCGALLFFFLLCFAVGVMISMPARAYDPVFDDLQWIARAIVVTGPKDDFRYMAQMAAFQKVIPELKDRDIVVLTYKDRALDVVPEMSFIPYRNRVLKERKDQKYMQGQLQTDDDEYSVVLVGKDGLFKYRWAPLDRAVPPSEIFKMIDAMPMRQNESKAP